MIRYRGSIRLLGTSEPCRRQLSPILTILDALPDGFRCGPADDDRRGWAHPHRLRARGWVQDQAQHCRTSSSKSAPEARIIGIDPTHALVVEAEARARAAG